MPLQFFKRVHSQNKKDESDAPKINGKPRLFPKQRMIIKAITITLDNIIHRVNLNNFCNLWAKHVRTPHNWCHPHAELEKDVHNLD